jgi:hypothetical protein
MEHPYRVHSSIGFGFLQLLCMASLAYPSPQPPVYHNTAVIRLMGTVYFTIFQDKPVYLKLECVTILLEMICDILYIKYIILDYTYFFGLIDISSNALLFVFLVLSLQNDYSSANTKEMMNKINDFRTRCASYWIGSKQETSPPREQPLERLERTDRQHYGHGHIYTSIPSHDDSCSQKNEQPVYTFGGRQAFKPSFYNSSWGRDYIEAQVEKEFDTIEKRHTDIGEIGMITSSDGTTQYIRFDDISPTQDNFTGIRHYANLFVSPYFTRDGTPITWFSGCPKIDKIGMCLFIYNIIQFIYQLMMYSSIMTSCREITSVTSITTNSSSSTIQRFLC